MLFYLVSKHALSRDSYFFHFFVPTLLGNIIEGVSLVAALGHMQGAAWKYCDAREISKW